MQSFLQMEPTYRDYIWGGDRLRPGQTPTAEAWVVYQNNQIRGGILDGKTLAESAEFFGPALLGSKNVSQTGLRFPLLIKLLDCSNWLSLQVHPDDAAAKQLEGPDYFGKTEAWHFIETAPDASILCGLKPDISRSRLEMAMRSDQILENMQAIAVHNGDSVFIPAGMIHALGPGLLVYEVQQSSDLTYRVWDWNRTSSPARPLHIDKSLLVTDPNLHAHLLPVPDSINGKRQTILHCPYFTLGYISCKHKPVWQDTHGKTFHALTVIQGAAVLQTAESRLHLERFGTALVPAGLGRYQIVPQGACRLLISSVEG